MITKTGTKPSGNLPDTYVGLAAEFLPRPIHNEVDLTTAHEMLNRLIGYDLNDEQAEYMDMIARLVEDYERVHHPITTPDLKPHERLKLLVDESGISITELGRILGDQSSASRVLNGKRELSKAMIRRLCEHFKMSADYFI